MMPMNAMTFITNKKLASHSIFAFALLFSIRLFGAAFAALVHALLPCAFEKTASKTVRDLYFKTHNRGS